MPLTAIEQILKQRMGLHSATVGSATVLQAVERRMRDCDMDSIDDYLQILRHSATEMDALIDDVIIPETWFYRDRNPFDAFSAWIKDKWLSHNPLNRLRVLSVPCSSGEEPYTLAMCLADLGVPATAAQIDAVDISRGNIDKALGANYGNNSFRGSDLAFRERHFVHENRSYRLKDEIRTRVSFARANLLDEAFLHRREPYDVIFCRNLLIYFDRPTQNLVIDRLERLLGGDGVMFLGHSETSLLLERGFTPLPYPRCFGFERARAPKQDVATAAATRPAHRLTKQRASAPARGTPARPFSISADSAVTVPEPEPLTDDVVLAEAFRLADQGHLDEAAEHCENLLQRHSHQADAHYLLGLIREAAGNVQEAETMLRKAIYLDPNHYEALTHLGVICRQKGDAAGARRFQERAARAAQRHPLQEVAE
jgi:chemotaxis protein methyltransferase WspC